jgi:hypothetical protein
MRASPIYDLRQSSVRLNKLLNWERLCPVREGQGVQLNVKMSIKSHKSKILNQGIHEESASGLETCQSSWNQDYISVKHNIFYYAVTFTWATCFDSFQVIFRPSFIKIQILLSTPTMHYGIPNAYNFNYDNVWMKVTSVLLHRYSIQFIHSLKTNQVSYLHL